MSPFVFSKANFSLALLLLSGNYCHDVYAVRRSWRTGVPETSRFQDPDGIKMLGRAFLGVSLSRNSGSIGHPDSETLQDAFDLNEVIDRESRYIVQANDDGWLVGGGEAGPYVLPATDSAHITIMDIGTFNEELGGISQDAIIDAIESGDILIPQMEVMPTSVRMNYDTPPELEMLFDLEPTYPTKEIPLPINWQLRFVANQLVDYFSFPNKALPPRFHCSLTRKVDFRSYKARGDYFKKCNKALARWREKGPQPLVGADTWKYYHSGNVEGEDDGNDYYSAYASGIWLYSTRQNRTKFIRPNFLPPYETDDEKMEIISKFLTQGRYIAGLHIYVSEKTIVLTTLSIVAIVVLLSMEYYKRKGNQEPKLNETFRKKVEDDSSSSSSSSNTDCSTPSRSPLRKLVLELSPASSKASDKDEKESWSPLRKFGFELSPVSRAHDKYMKKSSDTKPKQKSTFDYGVMS